MTIRFLADASLHHAIVRGCRRREPAIDFLSAHEAKLEGVPDPEVLTFAAEFRSNDRMFPGIRRATLSNSAGNVSKVAAILSSWNPVDGLAYQ